MIDKILEIIKEEINNYLKLKLDGSHEYVKLQPFLDPDGKPSIEDNAISMSLVKIEEERMNKSYVRTTDISGNTVSFANPPIRLNLYILFAATFQDGKEINYKEALKRLSYVIAFFQGKNSFTSQNTPGLDPQYGKLIFELCNLTFEEQNQLWIMQGNLYRPSALYKLKLLTIQDDQIAGEGAVVEEIDLKIKNK